MAKLVGLLGALTLIGLTACGSQNRAAISATVVPSAPSVANLNEASVPSPDSALGLPLRGRTLATPESLANDLGAVEQAIALPDTSAPAYAYLGQQEQHDLLLLEAHPDWIPVVLNALPSSVRPRIQANLTAAQQISSLNGTSTSVPHWKIIAPAGPDILLSYYKDAQQAYGVPWQYLAAINLIETNMGRIRGLSSAGAQGPMQFMPSTWAYYGRGDVNDPHDAILAAGRYLKAHGAPNDMADAIYAYNPSMLYVRAVQIYAQQMFADSKTFLAYYNWQVYLPMPNGVRILPEGFSN